MQQITVTGIVISAMPIGEYDRRIVLVTKELGRVTAFVRNARRAKSRFAASTMPFSFGRFVLSEGRNSYSLAQTEITKYFSEAIKDFEKLSYGYYFLEIADYFCQEGLPAEETLKLIYLTMNALTNDKIPDRLVRYIYELRMLVINGEYPQVFSCALCKAEKGIEAFSYALEGVLCSKCVTHDFESIRLNSSTIYALQFIVCTPVERLYTFNVSEKVLYELEGIISDYFKKHVDRGFKSVQFLEKLC